MTHRELVAKITEAIGTLEPPVAVYYADERIPDSFQWNCEGPHFCHIGRLRAVRAGKPMVVHKDNPGCMGAARFLGWQREMRPGMEYFLSHDEEGNGERYKKTPELARSFIASFEFTPASGDYCVFQRLTDVPEDVTPEVVIFFAEPEAFSGLYWLANYGRGGKDAVISPMTSGCGSVVSEPRSQIAKPEPQGIIGMMDPSARQVEEKRFLTISFPWKMFTEMIENIPGSFLEVEPWTKLKAR
jgi:uncharacterized protein (DUF169 family)